MKLTHVLGRTWALEGTNIIGLYRLDGGKCVLLDSGDRRDRPGLEEALRTEGLTPVGVLSSHIHIDHAINNRWLRDTYGCLTAVPAGEMHLCRTHWSLKAYLHSYTFGELDEFYGDMVCPVDRPIPLEDGVFSFCGADFRIIHTPGHSEDHVMIVTPDNVCYAGDAVFSNEMLQAKLPYSFSLARMLDSARRLKELDFPVWMLAHRGVHTDIAPLADATCGMIRTRAAAVAALVTAPMTYETLWRTVNEQFGLHSSRPIWAHLMDRNLRAYADYLVDEGALTISAREGLIYYAPSGGAHEA